eukprot:2127292-Alexandrium_andersonii.AAC.1
MATRVPAVDALLPAGKFCKNCELVRRTGDGVAVYRCLGHELEERLPALGASFEDGAGEPVDLHGEPFRGL